MGKDRKEKKYYDENDYSVIEIDGSKILYDAEDKELVLRYAWHIKRHARNKYAQAKKGIRMHRIVLGIEDGNIQIDHINSNGLDNRKQNLRICTQRENIRSSRKRTHKEMTSKYKGVVLKNYGKYTAQITKDYKSYHLGTFDNEKEAAIAYNNKAKEFFGDFAILNKIEL